MARLPGPGVVSLPRMAAAGLRRPHELAWDLHRRYGPVVQLGYGPARYVYLFGREANELVLSERPDAFTWREALRALEPVDGPTALVLSDGEDHRRRRRLVQPAFAARRIDAAVPIVVAEVDAAIDSLHPGQAIDLYGLYRQAVRRIVVRVLFGESFAGHADALGGALEPAMRFVDRPPQFQFPAAPGWRASRRARAEADAIVDAEISRRRCSRDAGKDVLGTLLDTELTDSELRDQVVSLIAAGYETTSAAVAWTVLELVRTPGEWDRARQEVHDQLGESTCPSGDDLRALSYVSAVVNEALRLWPPGPILGRRATDSFTYEGHRVPAGSIVLLSPFVSQRLPELWGVDSHRFRPGRWLGQEPPPFSFIPFGGPYRRCLGFALALAEIQAAVIRLVQRTSLTLVDPERPVRGTGLTLRPDGGLPVVVREVR